MAKNSSQPTYKRQRFLLTFIRQLKDGVTATDLQKLVFLYTMKEDSDFYEFVPYKFGSYSFQLAEDVDILRRDGYLSNNSLRIQAIGDHSDVLPFPIDTERGDELIRKAYREYPYYAINSVITGRIFNREEAEQFKQKRKEFSQTSQVLFTIGYEGKSVEAFINTLIRNNIRVLCDVRKNPLSRKFGFSKNKLKHIVETVGIKYIHIPDLGIESNKRTCLETVDDYKELFEEYMKTLAGLKQHLENLYFLLLSNDRIALMCYEKEPELCHRHVIKDYLTDAHEIRSMNL